MSGPLSYFLYGIIGGVFVDGMLVIQAVQAVKRRGLAPYDRWDWWASELVRVCIGGGLAWLFFLSHEVNTPLSAAVVGMTAPIIIARLASTPPPAQTAKAGPPKP